MRIGIRIAGGFVLVMLLNVAVATVGSLGLGAYSRRVATSSLAQSMLQDIGRLDFATDTFVRGGAPEFALTALKKETALLFSVQFEKMVDRRSIEELQAEVAGYESKMRDYADAQDSKARLIAERSLIAQSLWSAARDASARMSGRLQRAVEDIQRASAGIKARSAAIAPDPARPRTVSSGVVQNPAIPERDFRGPRAKPAQAGLLGAIQDLDDGRARATASALARQHADNLAAAVQSSRSMMADLLRDGDEATESRERLNDMAIDPLMDLLITDTPELPIRHALQMQRAHIANYVTDLASIVSIQKSQRVLLRQIHECMNGMLKHADALNRDQLRRMADGRLQANSLIYGGTALALLISLTLSYLISRSILRPLSEIVAVMQKLAKGARVTEIPGMNRHDEFHEVAESVTVFRDNALAIDGLRENLEKVRLQQLADVSFEGILIHCDGVILNVNEALCVMLKHPKSALVGRNIRELVAPAQVEWIKSGHELNPAQTITGEVELLDGENRPIPVEIHARRIDYSGRPATAVAVRDLTARRRAEATLVHLARHDPLTGLPNRLLLNERLGLAIAGSSHAGTGLAVLCLDLDRFKVVNDQLGHAAGDELLIQVSQRLSSMLRPNDTAARLGGDEFAIVLAHAEPSEPGTALCQRIIKSIGLPFTVQGKQVVIGTSIGVAIFPSDGTDVLALLRSADIAMYRAKAEGRNRFRFYDSAMDEQLRIRHELERDLRQALSRGALEMHYQPLVCGLTGAVQGFEALARWNHPERGIIAPKDFVSVAEETGQIDQLGRWALHTACIDAASWGNNLHVAVNLSPVQFRQNDLPRQIEEILSMTGLPPGRLEIEVTEGVLIDHPENALRVLSEIRKLGVRISLDDFGTGYSSLNYLQKFPFDKIKIDQSFIEGLGESEESIAIVRAVIGLGRSLKLLVIAEGVETRRQLDVLRAERCDQLQGYLLGQPMASQALARYIAARSDEPSTLWLTEGETKSPPITFSNPDGGVRQLNLLAVT